MRLRLDTRHDIAGKADRPIVIAPLVSGERTFDPGPLGGKAVVLRMDHSGQSSSSLPRVMSSSMAKAFFDPEPSFWGGKAPEIVWPE